MSHLAQASLLGDVIGSSAYLIPWLTSPPPPSFSALQPAAWRILEGKALEGSCQKLPGQVN